MSGDSVRVAVRVRPLMPKEELQACKSCVRTLPSPANQVIVGKDRGFTFDKVFPPSSVQKEVYDTCVSELLASCLEGYNATVFAYGQTGSGKTFTMGTDGGGFMLNDMHTSPSQEFGEKSDLEPDSLASNTNIMSMDQDRIGIVPRLIENLFTQINELAKRKVVDKIGQVTEERQFRVRVSYLEIYSEEIRDLLHPSTPSKNIAIREDADGGIVVVGVQEEIVETAEELFQCLIRGSLCRATGSTLMNEASSRSHSIFTVILEQKIIRRRTQTTPSGSVTTDAQPGSAVEEDEFFASKFHLVDLAGSERNKRTGAVGTRFKEAVNINAGLLALGNVISALGDEKRRAGPNFHVPYRDSKLTRLLQDSLGGNSRTWMVACVSPADSSFDETLNTLKYANRARNIRNQPVKNVDPQAIQLKALRDEIALLQQQLVHQNQNQSLSVVQASGFPLADMSFTSVEDLLHSHDLLQFKVKKLEDVLSKSHFSPENEEKAKRGALGSILAFVSRVLRCKTVSEVDSTALPDVLASLNMSMDSLRSSGSTEEIIIRLQQDALNWKQKWEKQGLSIRQLEEELFESQQLVQNLQDQLKDVRGDLQRDEEIFTEKMEEMQRLWDEVTQLRTQLAAAQASRVHHQSSHSFPLASGASSSRPSTGATQQSAWSPSLTRLMEHDRELAANSLEDDDAVLVRSPENSILSPDDSFVVHRMQQQDFASNAGTVVRPAAKPEPSSSVSKRPAPIVDAVDESRLEELRQETRRRPRSAASVSVPSPDQPHPISTSASAAAAMRPQPQRKLVFSPSHPRGKPVSSYAGVHTRPATAPKSFGSSARASPSGKSSMKPMQSEMDQVVAQREALEKLQAELAERERLIHERESVLAAKATLEQQSKTPRKKSSDSVAPRVDDEELLRDSIVNLDKQIIALEHELGGGLSIIDDEDDQGTSIVSRSKSRLDASDPAMGSRPSSRMDPAELALHTAQQVRSELETLRSHRDAMVAALQDKENEARAAAEYAELSDRIDILEAQLRFKDESIAQLRTSVAAPNLSQSANTLPTLWAFVAEEEDTAEAGNVLKRYFDAMVDLKVALKKQDRDRKQLELELVEKSAALDNLQRSIRVLEKEFDRRLDKQAQEFRVQQGIWAIERERLEQERRDLERQISGSKPPRKGAALSPAPSNLSVASVLSPQSASSTPAPPSSASSSRGGASPIPSARPLPSPVPASAPESAVKQRDEQIQLLEKDNYYYRQTNRELKKRLRDVLGTVDKEKKQWQKDRQQLLQEIENLKEFVCQDPVANSLRQVVRRSVAELRPLTPDEIAQRKQMVQATIEQSPVASAASSPMPSPHPTTSARSKSSARS